METQFEKDYKAANRTIFQRIRNKLMQRKFQKRYEMDIEYSFTKVDFVEGHEGDYTTLKVRNAIFKERDIVRVIRTSEVLQVISIWKDSIKVRRGIGSEQKVILGGDDLLVIGTSHPISNEEVNEKTE